MSESRHLEEAKRILGQSCFCSKNVSCGPCRDRKAIATALALAETKGMERAEKIAESRREKEYNAMTCKKKQQEDEKLIWYHDGAAFASSKIASAIRAEAMKGTE